MFAFISGSYVMGGLLLCKVGVLLLVTCYVKYARRYVGVSG